MRKLVKKTMGILLVAFGLLLGLSVLSVVPAFTSLIDMTTASVAYEGLGKEETMGLWESIGVKDGTTKLILGDSVANQIYSYRDNAVYSVKTGNMAMTLVWQYLYAEKYLDTHPDATDIYLCIVPDMLEHTFESKLSYNYLVIPLNISGKMEALEREQRMLLENMYGTFFMKPQVISYVSGSGLNTKFYVNALEKYYEIFPKRKEVLEKSDNPDMVIAETYILKIQALCEQRNVHLHLLPNPKKDTVENREYLEVLEEKYRHSPLYDINPEFFDQIVFYPEEVFKDSLHFKDEFLEDGGKDRIIEMVQEATGQPEGLLSAEF